MRIAVLLLLVVLVAAVSAQQFGRGRQRGRVTVRSRPSSGRSFRPSTRVRTSSTRSSSFRPSTRGSSFRPSSSRSRPSGRAVSSSINSFSSPSSSSSFSAPSSSSSFSAPAPAPAPAFAPAPAPAPLSFAPPASSGQLSFTPPLLGSSGGLRLVSSGGAGGFGPIRPANPSAACGPNCFGPGLDNVFAEPANRLAQGCVVALSNRIPGARVLVDLEGEISIVDQHGLRHEGVFDSFGRNLLDQCDI